MAWPHERQTDILIVGGGTGGCAAAMAATALGKRVILTESTDWLGGQLTSQAVPPDEHRWIEQFGCTRRYRCYRDNVRRYYKAFFPLTPEAHADPALNPGKGSVSRLCHDFRVGVAGIDAMLAYPRAAGQLQVLLRTVPVTVDMQGDHVRAVTVRSLETGNEETITAQIVLDATELGDLLPMAGVEYVTGAESQDDTGEPHAVPGPAQPDDVQGIVWCFPMAYEQGADHTIDRPAQYDRWSNYDPRLTPAWPGRMLSWTYSDPISLQPRTRVLFPHEEQQPGQSLWRYRRIICTDVHLPGAMPREATLVNWPQNDYIEGNIIDQPDDVVARSLEEARQLSLSFFYWMQTEAPRPDGGVGYPGLHLRPDLVGTADGLAKAPYIRESRRIKADFTVLEQHVGSEARGAGQSAERFDDSVGIGCYRIDLHPSTSRRNYVDIGSLPFQIPLGALLPRRVENLLPACKNIGTTHITNGCYRLHPVEWNIGEAAGLLAAYSINQHVPPRAVRTQHAHLHAFQALLQAQGIELAWPQVHAE